MLTASALGIAATARLFATRAASQVQRLLGGEQVS